MVEESDYDLDTDSYQPIRPIGNDHGVMLISPKISKVCMQDMQCMHHGATVIRWDGSNSHSTLCFLRLENDNGTLSWCKPNWSALRGVSAGAAGMVPDYILKGETDSKLTPGLVSRYTSSLSVIDMEDGHLDLTIVKEVLLGSCSVDIQHVAKRWGLEYLSRENNCITILYGTNIAENKLLEFVMPPLLAKVWYKGLRRIVHAAAIQRLRHTDRRMQWLKEQYLQLYFENERCHGPTPAEAIKVSLFVFFMN